MNAVGLNGVICTPAELALSQQDSNTIHCLTRGQSIGLALATESGIISAIAVLCVFVYISRNYIRYLRHPPPGKWGLIQEPMDLYMLSLFTSDLIQAMGTALSVKWVNNGKLEASEFCTAQGSIQQLGETTVAMTTLAIALHTLVAVLWRKLVHALLIAYCVVGAIWLFVILFVAIGAGTNANYETPTPYWCWIGTKFKGERIGGEYVWLWLTLFTSLLVYIPLYFWSQGNITVNQEKWWKVRVHTATSTKLQDPDGRRRRSLTMLAYPLTYSVIVLPLSIVRWIGFEQESHNDPNGIPSVAEFIVIFIYALSGALNVLLFIFTRPRLLLCGGRVAFVTEQGRAPGEESEAGSMVSGVYGKGRGVGMAPMGMGRLPSEESVFELGEHSGATSGEESVAVMRHV